MSEGAASETGNTSILWSLSGHLAVAICLFIAGAVVWHGVLLPAVVVIVWSIPATLCELLRKPHDMALVLIPFIYFATVGALATTGYGNYRLAQSNGERIIAAVDKLKAHHGQFPRTLEELTPRYLDEVPCATLTLSGRHFSYWRTNSGPGYEENAMLCYCSEWPCEGFWGSTAYFNWVSRIWYPVGGD
ncbi:MAG: hypothetical protein AB1646_03545 [Thermodesulfobacteriota bacterium]